MITLGIDIGSLSTKSAILENGRVIGYDIVFTGGNNKQSALTTYDNVLQKTGLKESDIDKVVTTGYGRENVPFSDKNVTEITCHAKGMHFFNPNLRTILDIGGQDSKAILIDEYGNVQNFLMNDKCAAGCGRFLEVIARTLEVKLEDMGDLSLQAAKSQKVSSMCAVFAETEVVSLIAVGTPVPEIIKGVHDSIAQRAVSLLKSVGILGDVGMSGGVANNRGIVRAIEEKLGKKLILPEVPQIMGAIGGAVIGQSLN